FITVSVLLIIGLSMYGCFFFFFQAEDGIRDFHVTGVQTCALPIFWEEGGRRTVTRVRNGAEEIVPVETGLSDGIWVEIVAGVEPGDEVIALNYLGGRASGGAGGAGGRAAVPARGVQVPGIPFPVR